MFQLMVHAVSSDWFSVNDEEEHETGALNLMRVHVRQYFDPLELSNKDFRKNFRFPKHVALQIIDRVTAKMEGGKYCNRVAPHLRVLAALYFYAQGSYQAAVGASITGCMSRPVVCRSLEEATNILCSLHESNIRFPLTDEDKAGVKDRFSQEFGMEEVIGVMDGTHVAITKPSLNENVYVNRKGYHSLNVMIVSDAEHRILAVNPRYPGSCHDSYVWKNSIVRWHTERTEAVMPNVKLLGDSGYPSEPWLLTPFRNPVRGSPEWRYNERFKVCRSSVERTIGLLKGKFRCLLKDRTLHYTPVKAAKIVIACCVLHNISINENVMQPIPLLDEIDTMEHGGAPITDNVMRRAGQEARAAYVASYFS